MDRGKNVGLDAFSLAGLRLQGGGPKGLPGRGLQISFHRAPCEVVRSFAHRAHTLNKGNHVRFVCDASRAVLQQRVML